MHFPNVSRRKPSLRGRKLVLVVGFIDNVVALAQPDKERY